MFVQLIIKTKKYPSSQVHHGPQKVSPRLTGFLIIHFILFFFNVVFSSLFSFALTRRYFLVFLPPVFFSGVLLRLAASVTLTTI